jgi:hypothetical protein
MIIQECDVKFTWLVPTDLKHCPYVILCSHGTHSHPPPPATTTPLIYRRQIEDLIRKEDALTMTLSMNIALLLYKHCIYINKLPSSEVVHCEHFWNNTKQSSYRMFTNPFRIIPDSDVRLNASDFFNTLTGLI